MIYGLRHFSVIAESVGRLVSFGKWQFIILQKTTVVITSVQNSHLTELMCWVLRTEDGSTGSSETLVPVCNVTLNHISKNMRTLNLILILLFQYPN
jgi:hypothetical protein